MRLAIPDPRSSIWLAPKLPAYFTTLNIESALCRHLGDSIYKFMDGVYRTYVAAVKFKS